jgi:hypothetical protein
VKLVVAGIMAHAALQELDESMSKETSSGHSPARPNLLGQPSQEQQPQSGPIPILPGPLEANRMHLIRACIAGTVSLREANGWSQDRLSGTPQPCTATSP